MILAFTEKNKPNYFICVVYDTIVNYTFHIYAEIQIFTKNFLCLGRIIRNWVIKKKNNFNNLFKDLNWKKWDNF